MKINLGCGYEQIEGFINIDKDKSVKPDMVWDVELGLPFNDNSVDEVFAKHFIEHIKNDTLLMNEIWRVCKKDALVTLVFPIAGEPGSFDWDHRSFWNLRKIEYLVKNNRATPMGLDCDFKITKHENNKERDTEVMAVWLRAVK